MTKITLIGIDTAKQVFHLVGIDHSGTFAWRRRLSRAKLLPTLARQEPCRVVLEACAASHHWARQIGALGHAVQVLAPQHVTPYRRGQKNDYRDAEAIVAAALSPGMHGVGIKTVEQQAEQALHRVRSRLLRQRNAAANELRGLLGEYGLAFAKGHRALREGAVRFIDSDQAAALGLVELIEDVLAEMRHTEQRLQDYERQLEQRVRQDALSRRLCAELGGVGVLSASALRVKVAEPRDFVSGRNFAAYLGLAPSHRGTGGEVRVGKLPKRRERYVRQLLIHGARAVVSRVGDKQDAQSRWLRALVARRGFNVACVALAHRNARQAWAILTRDVVAMV
jgi:transposase